jgi:hypothetical protein
LETGGSGTGNAILDSHILSIFTKATVGTVAWIKIPINKIKKVLLRHVLVVCFIPKDQFFLCPSRMIAILSSFFK